MTEFSMGYLGYMVNSCCCDLPEKQQWPNPSLPCHKWLEKGRGWEKKLVLALPPCCCWVGNVELEGGDKVAEITAVSLPGLEGKADVSGVTGHASRLW